MVDRPLSDKRPLGPFIQTDNNGMDTVLLTCDFDVEPEATQVSREELLQRSQMDFESLVSKAGDEYFNGEVADVRVEDHAVEDGKRGVRVVYDTQINVVFKDKVDEFENDIEQARGIAGFLDKLAIVSSDR